MNRKTPVHAEPGQKNEKHHMRQIVAVPRDSLALTAHVPANGIVIKQRKTTSNPLTRNLVVLLLIRCIALFGVLIAIFWVHEIRDIALPLSRIFPVLIGSAVLTALSFARLLLDYPATSPEFLAQVLFGCTNKRPSIV